MNKLFTTFFLLGSMATISLSATTAAPQEIEYTTKDPKELKDLQDSAKASQNFVELLDSESFGKSWGSASAYFQATINQDEWNSAMEKLRKPLGKLIKRDISDQRTAKDPGNLPKGDYMVMFYRSKFANKDAAYELVTLVKEDGVWKVLTYQVN